MIQIIEILFLFGVSFFVLRFVSWVVGSPTEIRSETRLEEKINNEQTPYRTPDVRDEYIEEKPQEKPKHIVLPWSDLYTKYSCPRCGHDWYHKSSAPQYCECNDINVGHFHLVCNGRKYKGCGAKFIMKAKDA